MPESTLSSISSSASDEDDEKKSQNENGSTSSLETTDFPLPDFTSAPSKSTKQPQHITETKPIQTTSASTEKQEKRRPSSQRHQRQPSQSQQDPNSNASQRRRRRSSTASALSTISNRSDSPSNPSRAPPRPAHPSPTHPANIYRNILIMEESLRQEYIIQRKTRRKYLLFNFAMVCLAIYFFYCVFIDPSIYRVIHFFNRLFFMIFLITIILFYISGSHRNTIESSRKYIHNTNKGLRSFNLKVVKIPRTWKESFIDWFWSPAYASRPGRVIKIVLSSRAFDSEVVEAWEIYRQEYWDREYLRSQQKAKMANSARRPAKQQT